MSEILFTKMHGIGNDYVYVDGAAHPIDDPAGLAVRIADRRFGVGGDGLIMILRPSPGSGAHVRMRMFNADGSEAEMCGNGVRCVRKYAHDHGLATSHPMRVETEAGVLELTYDVGADGRVEVVTVNMGTPRLEPAAIPVDLGGGGIEGSAERIVDLDLGGRLPFDLGAPWVEAAGLDPRITCVSMGNPHVVFFCRAVAAVPLEEIGPAVERLPIFPRRINVHVVQVDGPREVTMRTWERGSGITLACGTGASAVCVAGVLCGRAERSVTAHLPGGDLQLRWDEPGDVFMTGGATTVFDGVWAGE